MWCVWVVCACLCMYVRNCASVCVYVCWVLNSEPHVCRKGSLCHWKTFPAQNLKIFKYSYEGDHTELVSQWLITWVLNNEEFNRIDRQPCGCKTELEAIQNEPVASENVFSSKIRTKTAKELCFWGKWIREKVRTRPERGWTLARLKP